MQQGLIHIYTGDGKGKTTSAVGLSIRALGHGLKVCYAYFHKEPEKYGYTELSTLKKLGAEVHGIAEGHPFFDKKIDNEEHAALTNKQFEKLTERIKDHKFDLLILDEVLASLGSGFLAEKTLVEFIKNRPPELEVVLTGRGATDKMIEIADYVSRIEKVKHPFDRNINAREGIEY